MLATFGDASSFVAGVNCPVLLLIFWRI